MNILLSGGGLDSIALMFYLREKSIPFRVSHFFYNQTNYLSEFQANTNFVEEVDALTVEFRNSKATILRQNSENFMYGQSEEAVKGFAIEGRNLIFISHAASIVAESGGMVYVGFHVEPDNLIPDTSLQFYRSAQQTIRLSTSSIVHLDAPFLELGWTKKDVVQYGISQHPDYLTKAHYCHLPETCGKCDKCLQVKNILEEIG